MSTEENIPEEKPEKVNETTSQEQTIQAIETQTEKSGIITSDIQNMEVYQ